MANTVMILEMKNVSFHMGIHYLVIFKGNGMESYIYFHCKNLHFIETKIFNTNIIGKKHCKLRSVWWFTGSKLLLQSMVT